MQTSDKRQATSDKRRNAPPFHAIASHVDGGCSQPLPALVAGHWSLVAGRSGFTLIEILMAIGILAVGLLMAAALFPTAVKVNQYAYNNSMGSLICENGLAVLRSKLNHDLINVPGDRKFIPLTDVPMKYGPTKNCVGDDGFYPCGHTSSTQGFTGVIRQVASGANDYEMVVVSYNLLDSTSARKTQIAPQSATGTLATHTDDASKFVVSVADAAWFQRESTFVLQFSDTSTALCRVLVVEVEGSNRRVVLDRAFPAGMNGSATAWVFAEVEENPAGSGNFNKPLGLPSPVMSAVTVRLAL